MDLELNTKLVDYIKRLTEEYNKIPDEYKDTATICEEVGYDGDPSTYYIGWHRKETDKEVDARIDTLYKWEKNDKLARKERELKEYERLKKKYG